MEKTDERGLEQYHYFKLSREILKAARPLAGRGLPYYHRDM
jgi:hypothetical protein